MRLKQVSVALGLVFVAVLAVVVAKQMSTESMAVVIGVVCGVAAGIPTSVLLLITVTRRDRHRLEELERRAGFRGRGYPPVVVVQGGQPQGLVQGPQAGHWATPQSGPLVRREFHVVGDSLLEGDGGY